MNIEKFDVITLANNKEYAVTEILEYDERTYAFLVEVDGEGEMLEEAEVRIVEIADNGETTRVKDITDAEEQQQIKEVFDNHIKANSIEE